MIICPLEGAPLFEGCPVTTCMWNNGRRGCTNNKQRSVNHGEEDTEDSAEELLAIRDVKNFVVVGIFIESVTGKDIQSVKDKDIPDEKKFKEWLSHRGIDSLKNQTIPYQSIVNQIKRSL